LYDEIVFTNPNESFFLDVLSIGDGPTIENAYSQHQHFTKFSDTPDMHALIEAQKCIEQQLRVVKERYIRLNEEMEIIDVEIENAVLPTPAPSVSQHPSSQQQALPPPKSAGSKTTTSGQSKQQQQQQQQQQMRPSTTTASSKPTTKVTGSKQKAATARSSGANTTTTTTITGSSSNVVVATTTGSGGSKKAKTTKENKSQGTIKDKKNS
jgi:hypothetical protein